MRLRGGIPLHVRLRSSFWYPISKKRWRKVGMRYWDSLERKREKREASGD
jgi:hypothetical protein